MEGKACVVEEESEKKIQLRSPSGGANSAEFKMSPGGKWSITKKFNGFLHLGSSEVSGDFSSTRDLFFYRLKDKTEENRFNSGEKDKLRQLSSPCSLLQKR
ncbi:hypothetical protein HAX54_029189 [Datura stramonium]|uniref:Uncharacterized protein n=1 Tax=Datura stramonium TaxID=4076 RepID=A0ABS8V7K2_DATST|nr:hypothetical protein [Datura stramonium]